MNALSAGRTWKGAGAVSEFLTKENVDRVQNERYRSNAIKYLRDVVKLFDEYDHETIKIYRNGFNAESSLKIALSVLAVVDGIDLARLRELAEAEREGRIRIGSDWTPCAEGLPKDDMAVYVSYEVFGNYYPTIAFIKNGEWANIYGYRMNKEKVVAWLHLPAPYRADDTTGKVKEEAE